MKYWIKAFIKAFLVVAAFIVLLYVAANEGYKYGYDDGINTSLDTVNSIVTRQISDTAISSKFFIQSTDTVEFILNAKTIRMK